MDVAVTIVETSPYLLESLPASSGRVLLARGFAHYCALHHGFSGDEIAAAFGEEGDAVVRDQVRSAARLLGGLLASGAIRAWVRPMGGGEPTPLRECAWELDDFSSRFASSALDPTRPFAPDATPTHWIFADLDDWNAVIEASVADDARRSTAVAAKSALPVRDAPADSRPLARGEDADRFVRLPELEHRTGLSRSTIYRKMDSGRFPRGLPLSGNITAWRESEVAEWIANPT